jgi:hypothetical protein
MTDFLFIAAISAASALIGWYVRSPNRGVAGRWARESTPERWFPYLAWGILALAVAVLLLGNLGCTARPTAPPAVTAPTGDAINRAQVRVETAATINEQTKPHANETGKALLGTQANVLDEAVSDLATARAANANAQRALDAQAGEIEANEATIANLRGQWGYKLQRWVEWAWFWIKVWLLICSVAFVLRFVPGPVGMVAAVVFSVLWIPGWLNVTADNAYFRGWLPWFRAGKSTTPTA